VSTGRRRGRSAASTGLPPEPRPEAPKLQRDQREHGGERDGEDDHAPLGQCNSASRSGTSRHRQDGGPQPAQRRTGPSCGFRGDPTADAGADASGEGEATLLIERKAQALAREMYRKRMKLETEAVKAEMTTEASTESARQDAPTQERAEEASFVLDEAARLWAASGLVPAYVDERTVLRGLFELGIIAPGHKWQAKAEEGPQPPPTRPRHRHLLPSTLRPCSRTPVSKPSASASPASSTCRQSRDPGRGNRREARPRLPVIPRRPLRTGGAHRRPRRSRAPDGPAGSVHRGREGACCRASRRLR
jgi:hypothetical protein